MQEGVTKGGWGKAEQGLPPTSGGIGKRYSPGRKTREMVSGKDGERQMMVGENPGAP